MSQIAANAKSSARLRQIFITAAELTEGDIIRHFTGDVWMVMGEPEYKSVGITFEVMWLDVPTPNIQFVTFNPAWRFELVSHNANSAVSFGRTPSSQKNLIKVA